MAEKLCTLRTKGGGGGGKQTETVLWTNSAPTSAFAAQNVILSESIDNFKYIKMRVRISTASSVENEVIYSVSEFKTYTQDMGTNIASITVSPSSSYYFTRTFRYYNSTTVRILSDIRYKADAVTTMNDYCIPIEILGLNELDHGTMYTSNSDVQQFKSVSANAIPTFATKGKAVAIYITRYVNSNTKAVVYTNVNPTTGAINNNEIYVSDTDSMPWAIWSSGAFIVTDNQITTNKAFSTAAHKLSIMYTY